MKQCNTCKNLLPYSAFNRNKKSRDGYLARCRECGKAKMTPEKKFAIHIKHRYGLTLDKWHDMLIAQQGRCAVCNETMTDPVVDHCHSSGDVRKLLCRLCNIAAGAVKDNPSIAINLSKYLEEHSSD